MYFILIYILNLNMSHLKLDMDKVSELENRFTGWVDVDLAARGN